MLERQRRLEEEKQNLEKTYQKTEKVAQEMILNKKNSRPKLAFGLKPVLKQYFFTSKGMIANSPRGYGGDGKISLGNVTPSLELLSSILAPLN